MADAHNANLSPMVKIASKPNGYSMYIKAKMKELKEKDIPPTERLKEAARVSLLDPLSSQPLLTLL